MLIPYWNSVSLPKIVTGRQSKRDERPVFNNLDSIADAADRIRAISDELAAQKGANRTLQQQHAHGERAAREAADRELKLRERLKARRKPGAYRETCRETYAQRSAPRRVHSTVRACSACRFLARSRWLWLCRIPSVLQVSCERLASIISAARWVEC